MSFNAVRENKILAKISESTVSRKQHAVGGGEDTLPLGKVPPQYAIN